MLKRPSVEALKRLLLLFSFLAFQLFSFCAAAVATPKRAPHGIYALARDVIKVNQHPELLQPNVDGWRLRFDWVQIQPNSATRYDWSLLDKAIVEASIHGKKVGLSVAAGTDCPNWLFATGAKYISTSNGKLPLPNDPVYVREWTRFIKAFGGRYDSKATVAYTVVGGLGDHFEWYYGSTTDQNTLLKQFGSVVYANWLTMAKTFVDAYASAFQNTPFMGALGHPWADSEGHTLMTELTVYATTKYPGRFGISNSTLNAQSSPTGNFYPDNAIYQYWKMQPTGQQMLWFQTGDPSCRLNGNPCSAGLDQSLSAAVLIKDRCVEIYLKDLANPNLQSTITNHRTQLKAIPLP